MKILVLLLVIAALALPFTAFAMEAVDIECCGMEVCDGACLAIEEIACGCCGLVIEDCEGGECEDCACDVCCCMDELCSPDCHMSDD